MHWFAFHAKMSDRKKHMLLELGKTPEEIYHFSRSDIQQYFREKESERFLSSQSMEDTKRDIEWLERNRGYTVFWTDFKYPEKLRQIYDFPLGLCVKGRLPKEKILSIAMVGAREVTPYGRQAAEYFSKELSRSGVQIISGLARGVDGCSHRGALSVEGYTLGVLGCGIDLQYPKSNQYLYEQMEEKGGIISEYPIGTPPFSSNFPKRNRIISGISDGVFIIEAKEKSGSLITADFALEQNREVFALPGRYYDELSYGCLNLLQKGAKLVYHPKNITEEYAFFSQIQTNFTKQKNFPLADKEKVVYDCLRLEPKYIDKIVSECCLPVSEVLTILTILEIKQYIIQTQKNYYRIKE
jgi:DNA processing protein